MNSTSHAHDEFEQLALPLEIPPEPAPLAATPARPSPTVNPRNGRKNRVGVAAAFSVQVAEGHTKSSAGPTFLPDDATDTTKNNLDAAHAVPIECLPTSAAPKAALGPGATMQDVIDLAAADSGIPDRKRRNWVCSIGKFTGHLGLDLHMRADFATYRGHLRRFSLAGAHISKARWSNIRSDVAAALRHYGARTRAPTPKDLSPEWRALRAVLPDIRLQRGLSRPIHWCSASGILPEEVDDAVLQRFHRHLIDETFESKPDRIFRDTAMLWNRAVASIPDWPRRPVTVPSFRKRVSLPRRHFPESFGGDLERYARRLAGKDLTAKNLPVKPLAAQTIDQHLKQLLLFASAMAKVGRPAREIVGIAALFDDPWFEQAIQAEFDRLGGARPSLQELSATLLAIARHHLGLPRERIDDIVRIKKWLTTRPRGFTEKNRERLRPFTDPRVQARFLHFGDGVFKLVGKARSPKKAALLCQIALTHELLVVAPLRFGNLIGLNIFEHIRFTGAGRTGKAVIAKPGHQVKNGVDLEFELPMPVANLLRVYLDRWRPILVRGEDKGWLFPGEKRGTPKHQVTLGGQLVKALKKHAGLTVNPHLYRHLAAFFFLRSHPGEFETVRRLLGHKSLETTMMFYADFDRALSIKRYQDSVLADKERLRPSPQGDASRGGRLKRTKRAKSPGSNRSNPDGA